MSRPLAIAAVLLAIGLPKSRGEEPADLIVSAGHVWTADPANPRAEAVAVRDGVIVFVGSKRDAEAFRGERTQRIEHDGGMVLPGLVDAHGHLAELGAERETVDLRDGKSAEDVAAKVAKALHDDPGGDWIVGRGWDQSLWPGGRFPTAAVLDRVSPDRPVWLTRVDGHAGWANSEALRRGNVRRETGPPPGGQILKNDEGLPTGVLVDAAMGLVGRVVPEPGPEVIAGRILKAQRICFENGLTGVHDASVSPTEASAFRSLDEKGELKLRVYGMAMPPTGEAVAFASSPPVAPRPGGRFTMRAIKVFIDGAMGSRGALLFEPYADDPRNSGLQLTDPKALEALTVAALKHGWQVCTHAIGDKGNALVLDAFAAARAAVPGAEDPRLRIEHAQAVRREDVNRFKELGVIASMQPSHASDDMRWVDARLGPDRARGAYAWRWFLDAGVPLACGSDFPVEVVDPFWGIFAGVTRQDRSGNPPGGWHPSQKMTLEETLRGFTTGASFASFRESEGGRVKVGMRADLTLIDRDLFAVPPSEILDAKVTETIVDGEVVFRR